MASTYSSLLRLELIGTGDQSGTWGITTNTNFGTIVEDAVAGTATIDVTAGNVTLTNLDGVADQARCMILRVIGTPGTSRNIVAPSASKVYVVLNGSDSSVVVKGSATTGLTVASGDRVTIAWNGTDFVQIGSTSGGGDVLGPGSATDNAVALFDGTSGKILKNSAKVAPSGAFVGTTDSQTLTNKTISGTNNTLSGINLESQITGTLPVANGGTGVTSLSGVVIGNGGSAMTAKANPTGAFVGTTDIQTLTNKTLTAAKESTLVSVSGAGSFVTLDLATASAVYLLGNATSNSSLNLRWNESTTLNSVLAVGESITIAFLSTQGSTGYFISALAVDGGGQTVKWINGSAPSTGNPNSVDAYVFTVIKTAPTPAYTVFGSRTRYA
jgi:hypothetical protein